MDRLLLVLTLAVAPVLLFPLKFQFPLVAMTVPLLWLVRWPISGRLLPSTPLNLPLAILGVSVLASVFSTPDLYSSLNKIAGTVFGFFLFFAVVGFLGSEIRVRHAVLGFAGCGSTFALLSLAFTQWKSFYQPLGTLAETLFPVRFSLPGFEGGVNPNPVAGSLVLFFPLLCLLSRKSRRETDSGVAGPFRLHPWLFRTAFLIVALVLLLTQSRSAWVGVLVSLAFLAVGFLLSPRAGRYTRFAPEILLSLLVFGGMIGLFTFTSSALLTNVEVARELPRQEIWARAIWAIQDFPLTGLGMNTFRKVAGEMYPFYNLLPDLDIASAHNLFLQIAVDLGVPALVVYGAIWFAVLRMLFLLARKSITPFMHESAVGIGAGLAGYFAYQLADAVPLGTKLGTLWWFVIALVTAMYSLEFGKDSGAIRGRLASLTVSWIGFSVVSVALLSQFPRLAILVAIAGSIALGFTSVKEPRLSTEESPKGRSRGLSFSVLRLTVILSVVLSALTLPQFARAVRANVVFLQSLKRPEMITDLRPDENTDGHSLRAIGNAHWRLGNNSEAARFFTRSLSTPPQRPITVFKSVLAHMRAGRPQEAQTIRRKHGLPLGHFGSFAYKAHLAGDPVDAILSADLILNSLQPDANSLCTAGRVYGSLGLFETVRSRILEYVETLDRTLPMNDECSYSLGLLTFEKGDLRLALSFWEPILRRAPEDQAYGIRAKGCYIAFRLALFYARGKNAEEAIRYYRETGRNWCAGVDTWYSRQMTGGSPTR